METKLWKMSPDKPDVELLKEAASYLKQGETIGFPTETVYGLGANALDLAAVQKIYQAKGRPSDNPLIVHVSDKKQVNNLVRDISPKAEQLMQKFWPGPLTLVLPKSNKVPDIITAGLDTVAVRMPAHPVALKLIELAQLPIAAPSANTSGKPSPTSAEHVYEDLHGKIAGIVDAGKAGIGVESTVLDLSSETPTILRPGGITREELITAIGPIIVDPALMGLAEIPRSPGMKYTHYSPEAELFICLGTTEEIINKIKRLIDNNATQKIGLMLSEETFNSLPREIENHILIKVLGKRSNLKAITSKLFEALRWFDKQKVDVIYAENYPENSIGAALMNRLYKAAGGKTI